MNDLIALILGSGAPLVYVTMAGVLAQRAGVWHLGLEGLMIVGACAAVLVTSAAGLAAGGPAASRSWCACSARRCCGW